MAGGTPVVLLSECTLVPPVLAAVRERHPDVRLVWIDAHGHLNTPATIPSGFLGGMPFAELLGWCFDDWRRQAGLEPPLPEERAVLVGGRDLDPGERETSTARNCTRPTTPRERWQRSRPTRRSTCTWTPMCSTRA